MFAVSIKFGEKSVGKGQSVYFIADIGANFDGDLKKAKKLAKTAAEAGADCVKFQTFSAPKIVSTVGFSKIQLGGAHATWNEPVHKVFKKVEFPRGWHKELMKYCKELGVHFSSSPYDKEAVDLLVDIGVPFIKIGSGEITWHEMLGYIAKKGLPMILATGAATFDEVKMAVDVIKKSNNNQLILLQCITNYPSRIESANIKVIKTYRDIFETIVGYSDHSPGDIVVLGSVALGAKVIEKHFTLNKKDTGPDHPHSMEPQEFKLMVEHVRSLESALGSGYKEITEEEWEAKTPSIQRRGIYSNKKIFKGNVIQEKDVVMLRPQLGLAPYEKCKILGKKVKKDIKKGEAIDWHDFA